ncbi:MAG TPA: hypothetical protein VHH34_24195, partial [Pseudonocardiaceae bacterium]|nr:hypothetical protein [Pseudonocardiaceae bacterium]
NGCAVPAAGHAWALEGLLGMTPPRERISRRGGGRAGRERAAPQGQPCLATSFRSARKGGHLLRAAWTGPRRAATEFPGDCSARDDHVQRVVAGAFPVHPPSGVTIRVIPSVSVSVAPSGSGVQWEWRPVARHG